MTEQSEQNNQDFSIRSTVLSTNLPVSKILELERQVQAGPKPESNLPEHPDTDIQLHSDEDLAEENFTLSLEVKEDTSSSSALPLASHEQTANPETPEAMIESVFASSSPDAVNNIDLEHHPILDMTAVSQPGTISWEDLVQGMKTEQKRLEKMGELIQELNAFFKSVIEKSTRE